MESGYCWGAVILLFIVLIVYSGHAQKKHAEQKKTARKEEAKRFAQRPIEIIQESMDLIKKTKNLDTVIGRFDTIFNQLDQLSKLLIQYECPDLLKPSPQEMKESYSKDRDKFIRGFVIGQADDDIGRANAITRNSSKITILDKALLRLFDGKQALNSDQYDADFTAKENEIRQMIESIQESKKS